jgi:hypothetical protein
MGLIGGLVEINLYKMGLRREDVIRSVYHEI